MRRRLLLIFSMGAALCAPPARAREFEHFLTPGEMLEVIDHSKTAYKFEMLRALKTMGPEQFAEAYWPSSGNELEFPWIADDGNGGRVLKPYPFEGGSLDILNQAEAAYGEKNYERAAELYRKAIVASPRCYFAYIGLGDCAMFLKDLKRALEYYQKAIDLNPYDFRGFSFKAHVLAMLNRFAEAKEALIESLTLRPRRESVLSVARRYAIQMGVWVDDAQFLPQSLARAEGGAVAIYTNPGDLPWFAYAVCKGLWLGEPAHRKEMTGDTQHSMSTQEELECLMALVIGYEQGRENGKAPQNAVVERIEAILKDKMLDGFVSYQITARLSPDVVLLFTPEERRKLRSYVARYVLVPVGESGSGKGRAGNAACTIVPPWQALRPMS